MDCQITLGSAVTAEALEQFRAYVIQSHREFVHPRARDQALTAMEVAAHLKVSRRTVYRMLRSRGLPGFRMGKQWRFERAQLRSWLSLTALTQHHKPRS